VLLNLLSNAVKFTPAGGTIEVQSCVDGSVARMPLVAGEPVTFQKVIKADGAGFMAAVLTPDAIGDILALVPDEWLAVEGTPAHVARENYRRYFLSRLAAPRAFVDEAINGR